MPRKSEINRAPQVHAALAAAMTDPRLLENWLAHPSSLRDIQIEDRQLDLSQIRNFLGLVTKVRYNDLRTVLPVTFKLIDRASISIPMFADYALKATALRSRKPTQTEKIEALVEFLGEWLDRTNPIHAMVWDVLRHEHAILSLRQVKDIARTWVEPGDIRADAVPRLNGLVLHHEMTCRPADVATALGERDSELAEIPRRRSLYAYFGDEQSGRVRISEIDETAFVILELTDGSRSVGDMAKILRAAGFSVKSRQLNAIIAELVSSGMLATSRPG